MPVLSGGLCLVRTLPPKFFVLFLGWQEESSWDGIF